MENERVCDIVGIGDIWVETYVGFKLKLKNVRHILDILLKLISFKAL